MESACKSKCDYSQFVYVIERGEYGHIVCVLKNFQPKNYKNRYHKIIEYMVKVCASALHISKKYDHKTVFVHIYLNDCSTHNFSMKLAKAMTNTLYDIFSDTLEKGYIYSKSNFFAVIFKLLTLVLAPKTMAKFKHIKIK